MANNVCYLRFNFYIGFLANCLDQTIRKIEEIEKLYNGQTVKKIRFIVIEPNTGNKEKPSMSADDQHD